MTTQTPAPPPNSIDVSKLGSYLDGWADVIDGMGDKAEQIKSDLLKRLLEREVPKIKIGAKTAYVTLTSDKRPYLISTRYPGATTTIYVAQYGKDLYACWRSYQDQVLNTILLLAMGAIALFYGAYKAIGARYIGAGTAFLVNMVGAFIVMAFLVGVAGHFLKGNSLSFFLITANLFDQEDTTAMNLIVHHTMLRALDHAGIDISKLRLKQDFSAGERGETL